MKKKIFKNIFMTLILIAMLGILVVATFGVVGLCIENFEMTEIANLILSISLKTLLIILLLNMAANLIYEKKGEDNESTRRD